MRSFTCFLHVSGRFTPDLRIISCEPVGLLAALAAAVRHWPEFQKVDVYDHRDRPRLRLFRDQLSRPVAIPAAA